MFTCSVCQECFTASSHVSVLNCGHLYHEVCISTWLIGHNTCPQCRSSIRNKPFRAYFNIDETLGSPSNLLGLQEKLDQVTSKLESSREFVHKLEEERSTDHRIIEELRKRVLGVESELAEQRSINAMQKLKINSRDRQLEEHKASMSELEKLKNESEKFNGLQIILNESSANVSKLLSQTPRTPNAFRQLCTFVEVLKQQVEKNKVRVQQLSVEVQAFSKENQLLRKMNARLAKGEHTPAKSRRPLSTIQGSASSSKPIEKAEDKDGKKPATPVLNLGAKPKVIINPSRPIEDKEVKKAAVASISLGAKPKVINPSRSMLNKSLATKRGPTVFTGMGGSSNVSLASATPREEILALYAKRTKVDGKRSSGATAKAPSDRAVASTSREPSWI